MIKTAILCCMKFSKLDRVLLSWSGSYIVVFYLFYFQFLWHDLLREILHAFLLPAVCFSEFQTGWIQIRPNILSSLIWVHPFHKDYQQTTHYIFIACSAFIFSLVFWSGKVFPCNMINEFKTLSHRANRHATNKIQNQSSIGANW